MHQFGPLMDVVNEALNIIIAFDNKGEIIYANKISMELLAYDSLEGLFIGEILPNDIQVGPSGIITERSLSGDVFRTSAYRKNHTCFSIEGKILPYEGSKGEAYLLMAEDISKIEALEKELSNVKENSTDMTKVKNEFVANVTHELRTPVNGILGNTRELMDRDQKEEDLKLLKLIERGCEDMHALINNILDFSKLEAGKFQLEPREFNFRNMMDYVKSNHINKINEKGLAFFSTISDDIPETVIGDELRIVQILNNLLSNAIKFTTVGKVMMEAVTTSSSNGRIEIFFMVMDTGIGIDKKNQDKLFKSFSQVEASISRRFGGTGLGLNISKQLVELMGGNIQVQSEVGKGTTFSFSVWLDLPKTVEEKISYEIDYSALPSMDSVIAAKMQAPVTGHISDENLIEIDKRLLKLGLSIDLENWEMAEMFADAIKQLSEGASREISSAVLRLKMAVQKENTEKALDAIEKLKGLLG